MAASPNLLSRNTPQNLWLAATLLLLTACVAQASPTPALNANSEAQLAAQTTVLAVPLTVEAAIDRATRYSPQILALRAGVEVAKQQKSAASNIPDPEGILTWGKVNEDFDTGESPGANDGFRLGARFYVPDPFQMTPRVHAGTANFQAETASLQAAKWIVQTDVRRLYAEIRYLTEDLALVVEMAHQYELILGDERAREGQGATTASEIVTAVHEELQAQNDLIQARYRWQAAQRELAGMLNLDPASAPIQLATNAANLYRPPQLPISVEAMLRVASQHRNDLAALHWRSLAAKSAYVEARNIRVPWVKEVEFTRRESDAEWWLGIGINVPLFSWTINNADGVQMAEYKLAEANEFNGVQAMQREIRDAVDEFQVQQRQQERNEKELAPLLAEMQKTLDLLKQTTNVMPSQVATTEAQITASLRLKLESEWLYQRAGLNLERAVGAPLSNPSPGD